MDVMKVENGLPYTNDEKRLFIHLVPRLWATTNAYIFMYLLSIGEGVLAAYALHSLCQA